MRAGDESAATREQALQKIGRNLVNFQRMEGMLKFILTVTGTSGPPSETANILRARERATRTAPMGALVEQLARSLLTTPPPAPPEAREAWLSHSISFEGGATEARDWRRQMRAVVRERNRLVHHMLAGFDPGSLESCTALIVELDAQRERVRGSHEELIAMVDLIRKAFADLEGNVDALVIPIGTDGPLSG